MADNSIVANPGSGGVTFASDQIGGIEYPRVKVCTGADGAATDWEGAVTVSAALPAGTNNIGDVDILSIAAGTNNIGDVDIASITAGDNVIGRVKITDGTEVAAVNASNRLEVDIASATGTVTIAAIPAGTNNIGDVDIATITAGDNVIGRVKLSDGTEVAAVNANNRLEVDIAEATASVAVTNAGTFAVQLSAAIPAGANTIGAVTLGASIPAGTNNIGDVDLASSLPAGTNNIGDVDVLSIAAGTNVIGKVISGERSGVIVNDTTELTVKRASITAATAAAHDIVAAVADKKFRVLSLAILCAEDTNTVHINDGTAYFLGDATNLIAMDVTGAAGLQSVILPYNPHGHFITGAVNRALKITLVSAKKVVVNCTYAEEV